MYTNSVVSSYSNHNVPSQRQPLNVPDLTPRHSRQSNTRPKTAGGVDSVPTRAQLLYASYMKPMVEKHDSSPPPSLSSPAPKPPESIIPENASAQFTNQSVPSATASSPSLEKSPDSVSPRQSSKVLDSTKPLLRASITFDHKANIPSVQGGDESPVSLYSNRIAPQRLGGPRSSSRPSTASGAFHHRPADNSGQSRDHPSPHRGQTFGGTGSAGGTHSLHYNHHRAATDSFTLSSDREPRSVYSVASPPSSSTGSPGVNSAPQINQYSIPTEVAYGPSPPSPPQSLPAATPASFPPLHIQAPYSPPPLQTTSSPQYSSSPLSPPLQTPPSATPLQNTYQQQSQAATYYQQPSNRSNISPVVKDVGKTAAKIVGSTVGRIALKVALGSVGDAIGDAISSAAGDAISSVAGSAISGIGSDAVTSVFSTDGGGEGLMSSAVDALGGAFSSGGGLTDPTSFIADSMVNGMIGSGGTDFTSAFTGDALSGLTDSFAGLSTSDPLSTFGIGAGGFDADPLQNYQSNQPNFGDLITQAYTQEFQQIAQANQAQQQAIQDQFQQILQNQQQEQQQAQQALLQQVQAQQQAQQQLFQQIQSQQAQQYQAQANPYQTGQGGPPSQYQHPTNQPPHPSSQYQHPVNQPHPAQPYPVHNSQSPQPPNLYHTPHAPAHHTTSPVNPHPNARPPHMTHSLSAYGRR